MRVVLDNPVGQAADVELRLGRDDATVGDLLAALPSGARSATGIVLDGRFCHGDLALSEIGLYEGARIHPADRAPAGRADARAALELRVIAGFDAGRRIALRVDGVAVGRDPECELTCEDQGVSRQHLRVQPSPGGLRATLTDLGSANGTWVEGRRIRAPAEVEPGDIFEAGDVAFVVAPVVPGLRVDPVREASLAGTIPFNRPPRSRALVDDSALTAPEPPGETCRPRFSFASALGPLVLGGVMVVLLHNILYALFMLLSPVLVIGSWLEQRRHANRTSRGAGREYADKLSAFRSDVERRRLGELVRRRQALPDLAELERRATGPDPKLWERRPGHDDFLTLSAGLGELPFRPAVADRRAGSPEAETVLSEHGSLPLTPVAVELANKGVVGVVGERQPSLALARALLCQATILHGPADLTVAVFTEPTGQSEWDWVKWLPHVRGDGGGSDPQLAAGLADGAALAAELVARGEDDPRTALAVLDCPALIEGRGAAGRALLRDGANLSGIVVARTSERLPAACTTVIELSEEAGEAVLLRPQSGEEVDPLLVAGVSASTARECARALARFEDADLQLVGGALPDFISLFTLAGIDEPVDEFVREAWQASTGEVALRATFALSEDGPLGIDLVADGPHGLVAGTTGAGKSELLRSLVASLAANSRQRA